jgi:hypothetical protein
MPTLPKPSPDSVGAGAPGNIVEITPDMIEAGVHAYYENAWTGWENPGLRELRDMVRAIFLAMSSCGRVE